MGFGNVGQSPQYYKSYANPRLYHTHCILMAILDENFAACPNIAQAASFGGST
jgi:hypothetical protein